MAILASPKFLYRVEALPQNAQTGTASQLRSRAGFACVVRAKAAGHRVMDRSRAGLPGTGHKD
jgi:hypothetical protein